MKKVILWTCPRSLSTSFYRCMTTLTDTTIKHYFELFCLPYYFGPPDVCKSDRYDDSWIKTVVTKDMPCEATYQSVMDLIQYENSTIDLLFLKEHAYHIPGSMRKQITTMPGVQHTFLIRNPALVLSSYLKVRAGSNRTDSPEINFEEAGYKQLYQFYKWFKEYHGNVPVIIDASDLQANPNKVMKLYCDRIGIKFEPHMTSWEAGPVPGVSRGWAEWLKAVESSTGIVKVDHADRKPVCLERLPIEAQKYIKECQPYYMEMYQERIH